MRNPDDAIVHAIEKLRDPGTLVPVLRRVWGSSFLERAGSIQSRLLYLNYKPFERARLVLSLCAAPTGAKGSPIATELAFEVQGGAPVPANDGDPLGFTIPEWNSRGWALPKTPELQELAVLRDPAALQYHVGPALGLDLAQADVRLLRYVPRKRAILLISMPRQDSRIYAKLMRAKDADAVAACFDTIDRVARDGALAFRVPRVLHFDPALATIFMSEVPGQPFTREMRRAEAKPFAAVGEALASLHRAAIRPTERWPIERQLDDLRRHLAGMGRALPALKGRIVTLVSRLNELGTDVAGANLPIHGNLFGDQILWDGQRVGIVDWDRLALGDPLYDVGRLLAHQVYESCLNEISPLRSRASTEAFILAYGRAMGRQPDRWHLAWHVAVELLLRAKISSLRPLSANWQDDCAKIVGECERLLHGNCRFLALPALSQKLEISA